jgi:hypothetical protein
MQYQYKEHTVKIKRSYPCTRLTVSDGDKIVLSNEFLPSCDTKVAAEDNAVRIADQYIDWLTK